MGRKRAKCIELKNIFGSSFLKLNETVNLKRSAPQPTVNIIDLLK
jgi:hypothetical protein